MIGIRSITYNLPAEYSEEHFAAIRESAVMWDEEYPLIRTKRINLAPITKRGTLNTYRELAELSTQCGIRWFNVTLDPWEAEDKKALFRFGYSLLREYHQAFLHIIGVKDGQVDYDILKSSAELILAVSKLSSDGKDNFRLGVSMNVTSNGPFFPFTMSSGEFSFSIALELTQEINVIIARCSRMGLDELREQIVQTLLPQIDMIDTIANKIENTCGNRFTGFDFSLAPIIEENGSILLILEQLGVQDFGMTGTMFATAYLTNIVKSFAQRYRAVGFSGIMYSLLEDLGLCLLNNSRGVTLEQMIALSTMCGCGLDMIPVYGKITEGEIIAICMDIMAISCRLGKPLGIRLLPIPRSGNGLGQYTRISGDADFIANTKIVTVANNILLDNGIKKFSFLPDGISRNFKSK